MPYECIQAGGKWKCVSKDDHAKVHGTHSSKAQCVQQLRALYANVPDAKKGN